MQKSNKMPYLTRTDTAETQKTINRIFSDRAFDPQQSYSLQVASRLRQAIVRGEILPGSVLSESSISLQIGISRTPIREALRQLSSEKLIDVYPQAGTVIAPIRLSLLNEGIFIRSALECTNIIDLAKTITSDQINILKGLIAKQKTTLKEDSPKDFFIFDDSFHKAMFEFTGRSHAWELIEQVKIHLDRVRHLLLERIKTHAKLAMSEHEKICEMLSKKQPAKLVETLNTHIIMLKNRLNELRENSPDKYFAD
jgi:GntR family transcriptional regulator, rspAB operon transcriptional repressor